MKKKFCVGGFFVNDWGMKNEVILVVIGVIFLKMGVELYLDWLNKREVMRNAGGVPEAFKGFMDEEGYGKSVRYTLDKTRFSMFGSGYDGLLLIIFLCSGLLPLVYSELTGILGVGHLGQAVVFVLMTIFLSIFEVPQELYSQFVIEERYGFNKGTFKLWVMDKIKGLMLMLVIVVPLIWGLMMIYEGLGWSWWIWGFGLIFGFQLTMMLVYPKLIIPLFNKLKPLEEGGLRDRLMGLAKRTGFEAETIEVMDGSKRSGHSNAFFTGMGKFRHIVLFDTLMAQLNEEEIEAVLAHEIGHYKRGHIPKMLMISAGLTFGFFYLIDRLIHCDEFYNAFGFHLADGIVPALVLFSLLLPLVTFWFSPVIRGLMRKHEYEADAFAKEAVGGAGPLISSLRKLSEKNLSNLTPDRRYSAFYYSHPTLLERERELRKS